MSSLISYIQKRLILFQMTGFVFLLAYIVSGFITGNLSDDLLGLDRLAVFVTVAFLFVTVQVIFKLSKRHETAVN